ncbi:ubiquitin-like modifier 1, partial [Clavulina sp. PMI_390]
YRGGAELLFGNVREHTIKLPPQTPDGRPSDVAFLIHWIRDNLLKERVELFIENDTVRPGILVLINDTDWELEDEGDHVLVPNDEIVFISTLHGG